MNESCRALVVILSAAAIAGCAADGDEPRREVSAEVGSVGSPLATNGGVLPPKSHAFGASYAEWSARWWQWAVGLSDPSVRCETVSAGHSGRVLFLRGFPPEDPPVTLDCTTSVGTPIFFPIVNVECSNLESDPFFGVDDAARIACAAGYHYTALSATIDGVSIPHLDQLPVVSASFAFTPVPGNPYVDVGASSKNGLSAATGIYLLLHPLSPGDHTISFGGTITPINFSVATTYVIHVGT